MKYHVTVTIHGGTIPDDLDSGLDRRRTIMARLIGLFVSAEEEEEWHRVEDDVEQMELVLDTGLLSPLMSTIPVTQLEALWKERWSEIFTNAGIEYDRMEIEVQERV